MSALSTKNPMLMLALAGAAVWALTRARPAAAAAVYRPSAVGATVQQQAADAARNMGILSTIGSWLTPSNLQPSVVTDAGRAAVRAGDSYYGNAYGGSDAATGTVPATDTTAQATYDYADSGNGYGGG